MKKPPVCLTIAGLDPSGGAGVIADVRTFSAFGCFATAAITSLTFQNTQGVFGFAHQTAETVRRQIEPVFEDFEVSAVKTGMLPTAEIIEATARLLSDRGVENLVVDPVVRSTSGYDLIDDKALEALVSALFPISLIVTPNIPEAERISGIRIEGVDTLYDAAYIIRSKGARNVLIKGGHFDDKTRSTDHLFQGTEIVAVDAERIRTTATHGTGCTLSAAITANLAMAHDLVGSVRIAKEFVTKAIRTAPNLGKGRSPINHLVRIRC